MNADSRHVVNVLLYYPITTMWADTRPLFSGETDYQQIGQPSAWKNQTILINDYYTGSFSSYQVTTGTITSPTTNISRTRRSTATNW